MLNTNTKMVITKVFFAQLWVHLEVPMMLDYKMSRLYILVLLVEM